MITKKCSKCERELSLDNFHRSKNGKLGVRSKCKICRKEDSSKYYQENTDKRAIYNAENSGRIKSYNREYIRLYYQENKEQFSVLAAEYYQNNKEAIKNKTRQWVNSNLDKVRNNRRNYKARRKSQLGFVPGDYWDLLLEKYGPFCMNPECDKGLTEVNPLTLDHVIPLSKGGLHCMSNFQLLCHSCNASKNAKEIDFRTVKVWRAV